MLIAQPQVIVMRADDYILGGLAWKVRCDVVNVFESC
jgi:hypothetical protein